MQQENQISKKLISAPMSSTLINKYFDGNANVKTLAEISEYQSLQQVFDGGKYNHVIIFIAIENPSQGHWVCAFKNKSDSLFYFDSYGDYPLQVLDEMSKEGSKLWGQDKNLLRLIRQSSYMDKFFYNSFQYQQDGASYQTCGRYVTLVLVLNIVLLKRGKVFDMNVLNTIMLKWKSEYNKSFGEIAVFFINKL